MIKRLKKCRTREVQDKRGSRATKVQAGDAREGSVGFWILSSIACTASELFHTVRSVRSEEIFTAKYSKEIEDRHNFGKDRDNLELAP